MNDIIVIGSSNTDMVIKTAKLPLPGETILGGTFLMNPGGKGANQAVAAARLGGSVTIEGGVIFNAANILLVAAMAIAGMALAFPVGVGIALVLGVIINYNFEPKGDVFFCLEVLH